MSLSKGIKLELLEAVGCKVGLGKASKMPCATYSLPASECKVGQKLAKVPGSVCEGCYADNRGNYRYPVVKNAMFNRLKTVERDDWVSNMTQLIRDENNAYFRWHDSGDIQSIKHLDNINQIAWNLPEVKFWLPTREYKVVSEYVKTTLVAPNLIIRVSAPMVNGPAPRIVTRSGNILPKSYVHTGVAARVKGTNVCPAPKQEGRCDSCRNCWDSTKSISYHKLLRR